MTPSMYSNYIYMYDIITTDNYTNGLNNDNSTTYSYAVRPVISLKPGIIYKAGNGSSASPYEIEY